MTSSTKPDSIDVDSTERLAMMTPEEVNALPYGFLILDREGVVQLYNRYESDMSRLGVDRVLGRNWFREIAPCTRVEASLAASGGWSKIPRWRRSVSASAFTSFTGPRTSPCR